MTKIIGAPTLDDALAALAALAAENESRGEQNLIFCEDRLTLLAERALLNALGGTFLTEVTTFARFLSGEAKLLSKQGSVMAVSAIISEHEAELKCFGKGAAQAVYETIAQLSASRVSAVLLACGAEETEGTLKNKLCDLAFLLDRYAAFLRESGLTDESGYLGLLPEKIASGALKDKNVFFFAFPSFTRQALEGVRAAIAGARSVTGIFPAGKGELYTNESARAFRRTAEEEGETAVFMAKCSLEGEALRLRDGLFSPEALHLPPMRARKIRRFTAADEAEEFGAVAALIKKHVAEGLRYRDMTVLVADRDSFLAVEKAFSSYRIPYFMDKKRPFSEHPFCTFVCAVLRAVGNGCLPDEADEIAASCYFGNAERYRNYLLKYGGYRGAVRREIKDVKGYRKEELSACREKMLAILALFPRKGRGAEFVRGVKELSAFVGCKERTEELRERFAGAEREFLDPTPLEGVLNEIEIVAGRQSFTAREFSELLANGCGALEIAMIPQSADAVFVGDATESKFTRTRVLFATGLTQDLPRAAADTAVISDGEIEKLSRLKVEIEPAIAQVNARARENLALNLCAFTDALYLSFPLKRAGKEAERGEVLQYAERLFEMPPMPDLFPYDCCEEEPAALRLLALKNDFEEGRTRDTSRYSALYAALCETWGKERTERLVSGGEKAPVPAAGKLVFSGKISPTLLESYFLCPYAGFASRALKLREREERAVLDTDTGTFVHAVLERTAAHFNDLKDEEDCRRLAHDAASELLVSPRFAALSDTDAGKYTAERLVREAEEVTAAAFRQLAFSSFRVRETEGEIALPELSLTGKTDRVDASGEYVRVIDYKTGAIDDTPTAYYTGRKLQLELYLKAAAKEGIPAGAFYFPAAESFTAEGETKYRMSGFFSGETEVARRMDTTLSESGKSEFYDGKADGKYTDRGMKQEDFEVFLDYAVLVSRRAEDEIRAGNIAPSPYEDACRYCKMRSLCGFVGAPRKEEAVKCAEIAGIVRRERGEK